MKAIAKLAGLGVVTLGLAAGLVGCAEDNDTTATTTSTGQKVKGVTPADAPTSSQDAYMKSAKANEEKLMKDKSYKGM